MLGFVAAIAIVFLLLALIVFPVSKPQKEEVEELVKAIKEAGEVETIPAKDFSYHKYQDTRTVQFSETDLTKAEKELKKAIKRLNKEADEKYWKAVGPLVKVVKTTPVASSKTSKHRASVSRKSQTHRP